MPHVPDLRAHERHDPELIAAHAAGDLEGAALATATDLLATCPACAELHADLRAITAVLPAVPAPPRTRDFRITPEQAARLRPTGWRGVLAAFASPRLSFAAPLGTGLAALGIAGLLLTSSPIAVPAAPSGGGPAALQAPAGSAAATTEPEVMIQASEGPADAGTRLAPDASGAVDQTGPVDPERQAGFAGTNPAATPTDDPAETVVRATSVLLLAAGVVLVAVRLLAGRGARAA